MAFLFLSPRSGRARVNAVSRSGDPMTRNFFLPEEPWVVALARKHGLQHVLEDQRERKRLTGCSGDKCGANKEFSGISQILCLVSVSPGKLAHGILTDWTAEEEYFRKGLFEALEKSSSHSTLSLYVNKVLAFPKPILSHSPQRFHADLWEPEKFDLEQIIMWSGETREELEAHFGKPSQDISDFLKKPAALRVPVLVCHLIAKCAWKALILDGCHFGKRGAQQSIHVGLQERLGGFPPSQWVKEALASEKRKRTPEDAMELRFRPIDAQQVVSLLRSWSGQILSQAAGETRQELQLMLEEKVMRLDTFAGNNKRPTRSEFGPEQLLHALCAAMGVRDRSN